MSVFLIKTDLAAASEQNRLLTAFRDDEGHRCGAHVTISAAIGESPALRSAGQNAARL